MRGGSYNYLCYASVDQLIAGDSNLQDMADRLAGLGYAKDAAKETMHLLLAIRAFEVHAESVSERLGEVWRAVEWWDSGDSLEDGVKSALKKYRILATEGESQ